MTSLQPAPYGTLGGVARAIERASLAIGLLTAFAFISTASFFYFGELASNLAREAGILRAATEKFIAERPDTWEFGSDRLNARLEAYVLEDMSYRIATLDGTVVATREPKPAAKKRITRRETLLAFGQPVGSIVVGISVIEPVLVGVVILLVAAGLAALISRLLVMRPLAVLREADFSMQHAQDRLRQLNDRLETIREEERTHIAREIHDEIGQQITAIKIATLGILGQGASGDERANLNSLFEHAMKTVRNIAWELRPSILDTLGLAAAIRALGEEFQRRTATRCRIDLPSAEVEVDAKAATQLFRICQELLTNVSRHAAASRVDITLVAGPPLVLEVADNGVGMPTGVLDGMSLGLLGIQERARRMAASLSIESVPQFSGTRVRVTLPAGHEPQNERHSR